LPEFYLRIALPAQRSRAAGEFLFLCATMTSSVVAGDVCFQATAKLIFTADIGRKAARESAAVEAWLISHH
jgi:hypothetical protein